MIAITASSSISLQKLAKWLCRQVTADEFASFVPLFLEIFSGSKPGFEFKPEPKTENDRKFRIDVPPPLSAPSVSFQADWSKLKDELEKRSGKPVKPVRRRGGFGIPVSCRCEHCNAPADFLYLNDGKKKGNQVRCKIGNHLGTSERIRHKTDAKYFCPHCGSTLSVWKQSSHETIYKCFNYKCPHYLAAENKLSDEEKAKRQTTPMYCPRFRARALIPPPIPACPSGRRIGREPAEVRFYFSVKPPSTTIVWP